MEGIYRGYLVRERRLVEARRPLDEVSLPEELDYSVLVGLGNESRQKLGRVKPRNLAQASRIPGLTPADVQILWVHLERIRSGQDPGRN